MNKHNLTGKNYFSKEAEAKYFGSSSFKAYDMSNKGVYVHGNFVEGGCEAREIAVINGEYEKPDKKAFLVGSYVHAWLEGPEAFKEFCNENYSEIYTKQGKPRADFEKADLMIETLRKSDLVTDMKNCEHEIIFTGTIAGVEFKVMVDLLDLERGYFADLKTTADIDKVTYKDGEKVSFIGLYDYKLQFAIYDEIIYQNIGRHLDCYVIVVDKKKQPDHDVLFMGNCETHDWFEEKLQEVAIKIGHMHDVKTKKVKPRRCEKCAYCLSTKVLKRPVSLEEFEERLGI